MAIGLPSSIRARVYWLLGHLVLVTGLAAVLLGVQLWMADEAVDELYERRVVPLVRLKDVSDAYAVIVVDTAHKVAAGRIAPDQGLRIVTSARARAEQDWRDYLESRTGPDTEALDAEAERQMRSAEAALATLQGLLGAADVAGVARFRDVELYPAFDPLTSTLDRLADAHWTATRIVAESNHQAAQRTLLFSVGLLFLAWASGLLIARRIGRAVIDGVERAVQAARAVGKGGLDTAVAEGYLDVELHGELARLHGSLRELSRDLSLTLEEAHESARRDPLTGLLNRRALEERMAEWCDRDMCLGASLLFIDIDHFKRINDQHGHAVGDAVLRHVSGVLLADMRQVDLLSRYGGEEFVAILPETDYEGAAAVAERLRSAVRRPLPRTFPESLRLSVSIGLTTVGREEEMHAVLRRADAALYEAKATGRDRVVHR
jgi:diguanylate cyclase (GGDEF)-like protein